jgi:hypothetical protein
LRAAKVYSYMLFIYETVVYSQRSGNEKRGFFKKMRSVVKITGTSSLGILDLRVAVSDDESMPM